MRGRRWAARAAVLLAATAVAIASLAASGLGAGTAIVAAGAAVLLVVIGTPDRAVAVGVAAVAAACSAIATPTTGPDLGRGLAIAAPPLGVAAVVIGSGWRSRATAPVILAAAGSVLAGPARALFEDPFLDAACAGCRHSAFALLADRATATTLGTAGVLVLAAGAAAMSRRAPHPAATATLGAVALGLLPALPLDAATVAALALAIGLVAAGADAMAVTTTRHRIAELERGLRSGAGATALLRRATDDAAVTIEFPPFAERAPGVPVVVDGATIARAHPSSPALTALLAPPAPSLLVALANERLDVQLETRVRQLRESRGRVVRRADEERRRLERDLHDGAQQHVLALGFDLRAAVVREPDPERRAVLESCVDEAMRALDDLREIAHGVYPPLLAIAGLAPALRALGTRSLVPLTVGALPGRLPQSVERVAYLLVSELAHGGTQPLHVRGGVEDDVLVLDVSGSSAAPSPLLRERIAALDGGVHCRSSGGGDRLWELRVPCG